MKRQVLGRSFTQGLGSARSTCSTVSFKKFRAWVCSNLVKKRSEHMVVVPLRALSGVLWYPEAFLVMILSVTVRWWYNMAACVFLGPGAVFRLNPHWLIMVADLKEFTLPSTSTFSWRCWWGSCKILYVELFNKLSSNFLLMSSRTFNSLIQ